MECVQQNIVQNVYKSGNIIVFYGCCRLIFSTPHFLTRCYQGEDRDISLFLCMGAFVELPSLTFIVL